LISGEGCGVREGEEGWEGSASGWVSVFKSSGVGEPELCAGAAECGGVGVFVVEMGVVTGMTGRTGGMSDCRERLEGRGVVAIGP
jgi:hypothetical protein